MKVNFYSKKSRSVQHLRALSNKLGKMVEDGSFFQLSQAKQISLRKRLAQLTREVRAAFSMSRVKRILASSALLIGLAVSSQAQFFASPKPFDNGLQQANTPIYHFADIDGDGDMDAFASAYGDSLVDYNRVIQFQENTGTAMAPAFGEIKDKAFLGLPGLDEKETALTTVDLSDVDGDGDLDIFLGTYDFATNAAAPILGWQNTGSGTNFSFSLGVAQNPFNFKPTSNVSEVAFVDLDGDGDEDVMMNDYQTDNSYEQFRYQENLGVMPTFPVYEDPMVNPFGLSNDNLGEFILSFDDIDKDGDQDLMLGGSEYSSEEIGFHYYENIGTAAAPSFAAPVINPFGLQVPEDAAFMLPEMVDIDGDGDTDIIATLYSYATDESRVVFYENLGYAVNIKETAGVEKISVFPTVTNAVVNWDIQMAETLHNAHLQVVDVHGRVLHTEALDLLPGSNRGMVFVNSYAQGMYLFNVTDEAGNNITIRKFFVK